MTAVVYLDSSAIVKLVVPEAESKALRSYLHERDAVSSALAHTEVLRAVLDAGVAGSRGGAQCALEDRTHQDR